MATTTVRLPDELRERLARAAERVGMSPHAFILAAVADRVADEERQQEYLSAADARYARILSSGETLAWSEVRACLEKRLAGERAEWPVPRKRLP